MANVTRESEQAKDLLLEFLSLGDANKTPFSQFVTEHATIRGLGDITAHACGHTFVRRAAVAAVIHEREGWEELFCLNSVRSKLIMASSSNLSFGSTGRPT